MTALLFSSLQGCHRPQLTSVCRCAFGRHTRSRSSQSREPWAISTPPKVMAVNTVTAQVQDTVPRVSHVGVEGWLWSQSGSRRCSESPEMKSEIFCWGPSSPTSLNSLSWPLLTRLLTMRPFSGVAGSCWPASNAAAWQAQSCF